MESLTRAHTIIGEPWIFMVLLICMALLAYVHNMYPARFVKLFKSTFNERMTRQVMREEMVFSHRASWFLLLVSALALSIIVWVMLKYASGSDGLDVSIFLYVLLALSVWVFVRQGLRSLLAVLIREERGLREFNFVSALIYKAMGFVFLPIAVLFSFFYTWAFPLLTSVLALLLVLGGAYRIFRGWKIGRHYNSSIFYMITYLCALELIPTLVLARFILSHVQI